MSMELMTEPVTKIPRPAAETHTVVEWLDSLAAGECNEQEFLEGVNGLLQGGPDAGWELLALIDQYYRRGRITASTFQSLKTHLHDVLMGKGDDDAGNTGRRGRPANVGFTARPRPVAAPSFSAAAAAPRAPVSAGPDAATAGATASRPARSAAFTTASLATARADAPAPRDDSYASGAEPAAGAARPTAAGDDDPLGVGDVLRGRYRIVGILGQGGMGTVFEAVDQYRVDRSDSGQKVAIKVLHSAVTQRPQLFAELRREFQVLQSLSHPNIVRVHEFDRDGDVAFFTMEYLSGSLLSSVLAGRTTSTLPRPYALSIIRDVGAAVAHAHARGVIHGDINPANIFITDNGEVRMLDFGASHPLRRGPWISEFEGPQPAAVATPGYASCQLLEGETADARDDIFALSCVAYVLLTGSHPFRGHTALKARSVRLSPARPRNSSASQWKALRQGLNFERDRRPLDVQAWLDRLELREAAGHLPPLPTLWNAQPRRRGSARWVALGALAVLIGAAAWWGSTHTDAVSAAAADAVAGVKSTLAGTPMNRWLDGLGVGGKSLESGTRVERGSPLEHAAGTADDTRSAAVTTDGVRSAETAEHPSAPTTPVQSAPPAPVVGDTSTPTPAGSTPTPPGSSANPAGAHESPHAAPPPPVDARTTLKGLAALRAPAPAVGGTIGAGAAGSTLPAQAGAGASLAAPTTPASRARVELTADTVDVLPGDSVAHLVVRRTRSLRGDVSFNWWTESGTAKPGRDFLAVKPQVETIENGKSSLSLMIPIVVDPKRREARSFYVVIDQAGETAAVGPRTLTMVTIQTPD